MVTSSQIQNAKLGHFFSVYYIMTELNLGSSTWVKNGNRHNKKLKMVNSKLDVG